MAQADEVSQRQARAAAAAAARVLTGRASNL